MHTVKVGEIPVKEETVVAAVAVVEAEGIIAEIRVAGEAVAQAASNLGLNMLSANEELVQAHRQLCNVLSVAEVKQRSAMERLEKQSRKDLYELMFRVSLVMGLCAGIGAAIGGGLPALLLR